MSDTVLRKKLWLPRLYDNTKSTAHQIPYCEFKILLKKYETRRMIHGRIFNGVQVIDYAARLIVDANSRVSVAIVYNLCRPVGVS
jgi:hypothetical protein